ncbi:hypothetical protein Chor_015410 [Crotalus horridus]
MNLWGLQRESTNLWKKSRFCSRESLHAQEQAILHTLQCPRNRAYVFYGAPGVEFTGLHKETATVTQMHFLPGQGLLLSLLDDNTLHLWDIYQKDGYSHLEETRSFVLPGQPGFDNANSPPSITRVTVILLGSNSNCSIAYLGTEGGGIYFLGLPGLTLLEGSTLYQDEVLQSVPEDYRCGKALGPVESLQEHPQDSARILIGYSRGLMVLWDRSSREVHHLFLGNQQLESISWERSGRTLVSSHSDGGYALWSMANGSPKTLQPTTSTVPYGEANMEKLREMWSVPLQSHQQDPVADLRLRYHSEVVCFITPVPEFDNPAALVVLVEEELVVIDLQTSGWPTIPAPYLAPLHSSAITCSYHISNVPLKLWERIISAGEQQSPRLSSVPWPIDGGRPLAQEPTQRGLLLTGHEDGTVRFWDASGVSLKPLYKLGTANIFQMDCEHNDSLNQSYEEEWPPFRKVGCFDPYSDDPRLGVQKITLCKYTAKMVVAGTAGQVLVMEFNDEKSEHMVNIAVVDLLQDREGFTWKGHDRLPPKNGAFSFAPGFQPSVLLQCLPPAAVTAVTLHSEWNLVAFGTSHGFGLYDYYRRNPVLARCTLHPNDSLAMEGPLSRVKSLKKSLRQSFRRIRKSRVQEANAHLAEQPGPHEVEMAPVQRRIEPRSADDSLSGVVRCLYFADTFLRDAAHHGPTMWAGTNSGSVFAYALEIPSQEKFSERSVEAVLGKEIQLMHRAPVVSIAVFTLPKVSAKTKFKLTAHEGCRVRKVGLMSFASATCDDYAENGLACLTNLGDLHVFTVPSLRPQVHYDCIRKEDISGIASCVFTKYGQEFERFSLSTRNITEPLCVLETSRTHDRVSPGNNFTATPKLSQANGTHVLQGSEANHSPASNDRSPEDPPALFASTPIDSPDSSIDTPLNTTGDITVEEVKDFLAPSEEAERNLRNISEEEARSPGILIK